MTGRAHHRTGWFVSALTHATVGGTAAFLFAYGEPPLEQATPAIVIAVSSFQAPEPVQSVSTPAPPTPPTQRGDRATPMTSVQQSLVEQAVATRTVVARHVLQAAAEPLVETAAPQARQTLVRTLEASVEVPHREVIARPEEVSVPLEAIQTRDSAAVSTMTPASSGEAVESTPIEARDMTTPMDTVMHREREVVDTVRSVPVQEARVSTPGPIERELHADYGWLSSALRERIEQLKRYPIFAKVRRLEGRVVVEAEVHETGEIVSLHVAESSGHPRLDEEAIRVVRQSSPLPLRHQLGQPSVTIRVPITYKLDG
ncbi:MAG: energy transducer TonB [Nitrospira sp.]